MGSPLFPARAGRRVLLAAALALLALALAARPAAAAPLDDAGYLRFADRVVEAFDPMWDEKARFYRAGPGGVEPMVNANLLLVHSVAALRGHDGPARDDHRARMLARRLTETAPFVEVLPQRGGAQAHAPGFTSSMHDPNAVQHLVFDADVVDGLATAFRARAALGLPDETAQLIADRIDRTARGPFWRWPALRLNQFNWHTLLYAADHTVTGRADLLQHDFGLQLRDFASRIQGHGGAAGNLGAGMRFHYLPHASPDARENVDSAEYASIVLSFARFYEQARAAGMPAPPEATMRLLRAWSTRALAGYWTHGGYLNWDTGLGFARWHKTKKIGLAAEALIGLATAEELQSDPRQGRWAKWILDRGFELYERWMARSEDGIPPGVLFSVTKVPQGAGSARLAASRMAGNAARAIDAGLGAIAAEEPPALYSYDPDIGRLAVTTPAYNTAIVAVNQRAFPYGGIELARLYDEDQEVAANIGGRAPAAFGLELSDRNGRRVAATQVGRPRVSRRITPLVLTRAPSGAGATAATRPGRAFAGPFSDLRARGELEAGGFTLRAAHRFTPRAITTTWTVRRTRPRDRRAQPARSRARRTAEVFFPSWGGDAATVTAVLRGGARLLVGAARLRLAGVSYFHVQSERSGYVVVPLHFPAGATARAVPTRPQDDNPRPGPSLDVELARNARIGSVELTARYAPASSPEAAAALARALGAR